MTMLASQRSVRTTDRSALHADGIGSTTSVLTVAANGHFPGLLCIQAKCATCLTGANRPVAASLERHRNGGF